MLRPGAAKAGKNVVLGVVPAGLGERADRAAARRGKIIEQIGLQPE